MFYLKTLKEKQSQLELTFRSRQSSKKQSAVVGIGNKMVEEGSSLQEAAETMIALLFWYVFKSC
jgi:hypothetical protein